MDEHVSKRDDARRIGNPVNHSGIHLGQLAKRLANDLELTLYTRAQQGVLLIMLEGLATTEFLIRPAAWRISNRNFAASGFIDQLLASLDRFPEIRIA